MFASRAHVWDRRRSCVRVVVRRVGRSLSRAAVVAAALIVVTFATATGSQACSDNNSRTLPVAQTKHSASVVVQSAPQDVAKRSLTAAFRVQLAVANGDCCVNPSGYGHGLASAGTCCSACHAGVAAARPAVAPVPTRRFTLAAAPLALLPSIELDTQFRPPRERL